MKALVLSAVIPLMPTIFRWGKKKERRVARPEKPSRPATRRPDSKRQNWNPPSPQPSLRLSGAGRVRVVGEGNYQTALSRAAGGRVTKGEDFDDAVKVRVVLVPEPQNPYDGNAVRVDVEGERVGYLPRDIAEDYQPVLTRLPSGAWCPGRIMGGGRRSYGIHLHLGDPEHLPFANDLTGLELLDTGRSLSVTREEDHQDVLGRYPSGAVVAVSLAPATITKGKYKGERCVEVRLDGERVGELTFKMSEQYLTMLDDMAARGQTPGCEAMISRDHRGRQIDVQLPRLD